MPSQYLHIFVKYHEIRGSVIGGQDNARFRDELLNGELFYSLKEAQIVIEEWRKHYNTKRPHSALGYRPPAPETIVPMYQKPVMH